MYIKITDHGVYCLKSGVRSNVPDGIRINA
jgi:hypothetical protein